jgi:hypothetical protein
MRGFIIKHIEGNWQGDENSGSATLMFETKLLRGVFFKAVYLLYVYFFIQCFSYMSYNVCYVMVAHFNKNYISSIPISRKYLYVVS